MNALAQELTAGLDANKDGRVNWDGPEGGLQQAQQHMEFMVKGEPRSEDRSNGRV